MVLQPVSLVYQMKEEIPCLEAQLLLQLSSWIWSLHINSRVELKILKIPCSILSFPAFLRITHLIIYIKTVTKQKSFLLEIHTSNYADDIEKISKFNTIFMGV